MSSCRNSPEMVGSLRLKYGDRISYNDISDTLPVNVTFNDSCNKARKEFGDFQGYCYVDSGIVFQTKDDLKNLWESHVAGPNAMTAARTSTDSGLWLWFGIGASAQDTSRDHEIFDAGDFTIPVGKTVNLHVQIFSHELMEAYGYLIPDIYAGFCTESVFSFLCAAINKKFVFSKGVMVDHIHGMDQGSSGFSPLNWQQGGNKAYEHPFLVGSVVEIAKQGHKFGFGYEECENIVMHDPDKFDENGFALDDRLKDFIKNNQFVGNMGLFDYDNISANWTPGV